MTIQYLVNDTVSERTQLFFKIINVHFRASIPIFFKILIWKNEEHIDIIDCLINNRKCRVSRLVGDTHIMEDNHKILEISQRLIQGQRSLVLYWARRNN
ncbi:unnamed protein product [Brugia timori]|uniref:Uncharacterized protein n=1 Tax=Brugia timori TaxID=42155 RepID=A0A0R3R653_9BILA|nr:unnamed protein product [Brugia timori]